MPATSQTQTEVPDITTVQPFANSLENLLAELEWIDLLIQCAVIRARELHTADPQFDGLCISEREVNELLAKPCGLPRWADPGTAPGSASPHRTLAQLKVILGQRKRDSRARDIRLSLNELAQLFGLDHTDLDILLICLAPELDLRYEKLYAYLQDDVTKKRPSVDLLLNLLCESLPGKIQARTHFAGGSPLIEHQLVRLFVDPSQPEPALLRKYCRVDERIVNFLLELDPLPESLRAAVKLKSPSVSLDAVMLPGTVKQQLSSLTQMRMASRQNMVLYFQGEPGAGKMAAAEALCREVRCRLLVVDVSQLLENAATDFQNLVQLVAREARLRRAAVYWQGFDLLLQADKARELSFLLRLLDGGVRLSLLAGQTAWEPRADQLPVSGFIRLEFPASTDAERLVLWDRVLPQEQRAEDVDLVAVSGRFRLDQESIRAAVKRAGTLARCREPAAEKIALADLFASCRLQSNRKLTALARKVEPKYTLADIILPPDPLAQLRELLDQAKHRHVVYGAWGFGRKLSLGKGLNALFSGPPGTGKTMAAEVIGNELGLDLYKIDLSQIVSKYIGETEKNLDQIFREAQGSNAILFFDEADSLFGKRSEVKDAHDRYANIEIGYLLQKMEEYDGIAILATNLRQNLDEAFVRRMHVIIEFPFPDEEYRLRLWQHAFPHEAPIGEGVDFSLLARDVRLAGGNIKNIALAAAFYAASDGKVVLMPHLQQASRREHQKLGRTWNEAQRILPTTNTVC